MEDELRYLQHVIEDLQEQLEDLKEKQVADDDAIESEFQLVWDAINELQGVDPETLGEPIENRKHSVFDKAKKIFTEK